MSGWQHGHHHVLRRPSSDSALCPAPQSPPRSPLTEVSPARIGPDSSADDCCFPSPRYTKCIKEKQDAQRACSTAHTLQMQITRPYVQHVVRAATAVATSKPAMTIKAAVGKDVVCICASRGRGWGETGRGAAGYLWALDKCAFSANRLTLCFPLQH